ncbi:coiled-coil domain-containing protein 60 [Ctenodactylus gundi]
MAEQTHTKEERDQIPANYGSQESCPRTCKEVQATGSLSGKLEVGGEEKPGCSALCTTRLLVAPPPEGVSFKSTLCQVLDKPVKSIRYIEKEIVDLKKDLIRSRFLLQSAKAGRGYFSLLRAENTMKKQQQVLKKLEEEERNKFQPAKMLPDKDTLVTTYEEEKFKKSGTGPFAPIYSCILLASPPEAHVEPLFRQLCALHWLLEALTIDHTHHTLKPLITCFNTKDPGGSKSSIKKINKARSMEQRWEHFTTTTKTTKFKLPMLRITNRKSSRRGSTFSLSRTSGALSPQSSMISVNPYSDEIQNMAAQGTSNKDTEDNDSSSTKPDEEPLHIHLQKLLEMVREEAHRTMADLETTKKAHGQVNRDILFENDICNSMRAKFYSVAQEAGFCLQDKLEILMKRQEERALQKFQAFDVASKFHKDIAKMRQQIPVVKGNAAEIADHWYFDLLSKLPEDLRNYRPTKKILTKLQKFGENLDLRIRPHVLLKALQDLRVWELCSPEIAVAVEFVREHIIHMPQEDYITWLQNRTNMTIRLHNNPT